MNISKKFNIGVIGHKYFDFIDIDEKNAYLKWPIYNLLPDKYRIKEK